jgi:hypothetical protein
MLRGRRWSLTAWIALAALLLRAAVPLFAALAADVRGVTVAEICTVYGVAAPQAKAVDTHHPRQGHDTDNDSSHRSVDHSGYCGLTALAALSTPEPLAWVPSLPALFSEGFKAAGRNDVLDATTAWFAEKKQGPPRAS